MQTDSTTRRPSIRVNLLRAHGAVQTYRRGCHCRLCLAAQAEHMRRYRREKPETVAAVDRRSKQKHADSVAARQRAKYVKNREQRLTDAIVYYWENRERVLAVQHLRWAEHKEEISARKREVLAANPRRAAKEKQSVREWAHAHPELVAAYSRNRKARVRRASGKHSGADVLAQHERQRGRCFWCGEKVGSKYHVDHVVPLSKGGSNGPSNIVIACPSCNLRKKDKHPMDFAGVLF